MGDNQLAENLEKTQEFEKKTRGELKVKFTKQMLSAKKARFQKVEDNAAAACATDITEQTSAKARKEALQTNTKEAVAGAVVKAAEHKKTLRAKLTSEMKAQLEASSQFPGSAGYAKLKG